MNMRLGRAEPNLITPPIDADFGGAMQTDGPPAGEAPSFAGVVADRLLGTRAGRALTSFAVAGAAFASVANFGTTEGGVAEAKACNPRTPVTLRLLGEQAVTAPKMNVVVGAKTCKTLRGVDIRVVTKDKTIDLPVHLLKAGREFKRKVVLTFSNGSSRSGEAQSSASERPTNYTIIEQAIDNGVVVGARDNRFPNKMPPEEPQPTS